MSQGSHDDLAPPKYTPQDMARNFVAGRNTGSEEERETIVAYLYRAGAVLAAAAIERQEHHAMQGEHPQALHQAAQMQAPHHYSKADSKGSFRVANGDRVSLPPAAKVRQLGSAEPAPNDNDPEDLTMEPEQHEPALTPEQVREQLARELATVGRQRDVMGLALIEVRRLLHEADDHIVRRLQPAFHALAAGDEVERQTELGRTLALKRLATWYHGYDCTAAVDKATSALVYGGFGDRV